MKPNPPLYCAACSKRIPNRKDRQTSYCRQCIAQHRCARCGQIMPLDKAHECASVDLRGDRYCTDCGRLLASQGAERYRNTCTACAKLRWRAKTRARRAAWKADFGGRCSKCGYDRCLAALHFHHVNGRAPDVKRGSVSLREISAHPERFVLLCANCHIELHNPQQSPTQEARHEGHHLSARP